MNDKKECEALKIEKCIGDFIIKDISKRMSKCQDLCYQNNFPYLYLNFIDHEFYYMMTDKIENYENFNIPFKSSSISSVLYNIDDANKDTKNFILKNHICYIFPDEDKK